MLASIMMRRSTSAVWRWQMWVCLWLASVGNWALWRALYALPDVQGWPGFVLCLATGAAIAAVLYALLSLLAWRWTFKPVATLFLMSAACGTHFMLEYGVILDTPMMTNVLATDVREVRDLLNWRLVGVVLVLGALPSWALWRTPLHARTFAKQLLQNSLGMVLASLVAAASVYAVAKDFIALHRNHMAVRSLVNPLSSFYALGEIVTEPLWGRRGPVQALGLDAHVLPTDSSKSAKVPLLVLVVGETARAGHFALNGYGRDTTPQLVTLAQTSHVVSQTNVWSCGTSTEASLPCMFSMLGKARYESSRERHESLLDVLQRAGLAVLWVDNQSGCKGVCDRVPNFTVPAERFDEAMLEGLDARIAALPPHRRSKGVVVVLHAMGSHGPAYHKRSPERFKAFRPECTNNALSSCSQSELINAYDNSIRYTDYFLASTVGWLQRQRDQSAGAWLTAMIYVADHGESLGENNVYLHGLPYGIAPDVQKRIPWVTWLSRDWVAHQKINMHCLQARTRERLSHDHYAHSIMGLVGVRTALYQRELDIYAACR